MNCFTQVTGLPEEILTSLKRMEFNEPTPIQAQAIPLALSGHDILGSAQTGTGKTGAFAIPLVSKLMKGEIHSALVLTPTRELAVQVLSQMHALLGKHSKINTALLIGGQDMVHQYRQLRKKPQIIVGTPGRINDHLERGTVSLKHTNFLVLDETDRMLDMGFGKQIDSIVVHLAKEIQTLMFSATMPKNIMTMAAKYLTHPERVEIGSSLKPIESIDQQMVRLQEEEKFDRLSLELDQRDGSVVVFVKTKFGAKKIADRLYNDGHKAQAIHGNLRQSKRDNVLKAFRASRFRVLVATDVAARGLDVPHIQHVINHDLPQCPEDYIHRIGRTARAGATGSALNLITKKEERLWRAIERFMKTGDQPEEQDRRSSGSRSRRGRSYRGGSDRNKRSDRKFSSGSGSRDRRRGKKKSNSSGSRSFNKKRSDRSKK